MFSTLTSFVATTNLPETPYVTWGRLRSSSRCWESIGRPKDAYFSSLAHIMSISIDRDGETKIEEKLMPALPSTRRRFLQHTSIASAAATVPAISFANPQQPPSAEKTRDAEEISPAEHLMREHGVLNRILLIYDDHLHMLTTNQTFDD